MSVTHSGRVDLKRDWLVAITSFVSLMVLLGGLYLTNSANNQQREANREQQRIADQGQITDRYTKAVEQLGQIGAEKVAVRLGAIYALERIMRDSVVDQPSIVEVLAAFIRVNSVTAARTRIRPTNTVKWRLAPTPPPVDVQAAITVLGRRDLTHDRSASRVNLSNADLTDADLRDVAFTRANLNGADLTGAALDRAQLDGADLIDANLTEAKVYLANLSGANMSQARLRRTRISNANLTGARLNGADLTDAKIDRSELSRANLVKAKLERTGVVHSNLSYTLMWHAGLSEALFIDVNLFGADLSGADARRSNLSSDVLRCARGDADSRLPPGVGFPAAGVTSPCPVN